MSKAEKDECKMKEKDTFGDAIESKDEAIVLFYASWCPFSQRFLPIFEEYMRKH